MSTPEELKTFLGKRGYDVDVTKSGITYIISITSRKVEDVTNLLAGIREPGRFIVAVKLDDVIPTIGEILGVVKLKDDVHNLEETVHSNMDKLTKTDTENKRQAGESLSAHNTRLTLLEEKVDKLVDIMTNLQSQPWWKRFLGVK